MRRPLRWVLVTAGVVVIAGLSISLEHILFFPSSASSITTAPNPGTSAYASAVESLAAQAPSQTPAPAPSPVSTAANVSGTCTPGIYDASNQDFSPLSTNGPPGSSGDTVQEAYQLKLTNSGTTAAEVNGFSVVFYDSSGDELSSDTEAAGLQFLEPEQSLTWTEHPWGTYTLGDNEASVGPYAAGLTGAVDPGATCQLAQWTHPPGSGQ